MKRLLLGLCGVSSLSFTVACERIAANQRAMLEQLAETAVVERGELQIEEAHVGGDIGPVSAFDAPAENVVAAYDPELRTTNISMQATDADSRMGMMILNVEGVDLRDLEPGEYDIGMVGIGRPFPATLSVTGCSNDPACPSCNYDAPAERGVIIIEEDESAEEIIVEEDDNVFARPPHKRDVLVQVDLPRTDGSGTSEGYSYFVMR